MEYFDVTERARVFLENGWKGVTGGSSDEGGGGGATGDRPGNLFPTMLDDEFTDELDGTYSCTCGSLEHFSCVVLRAELEGTLLIFLTFRQLADRRILTVSLLS